MFFIAKKIQNTIFLVFVPQKNKKALVGLFLFIVGRYFGSDTGGVISRGRKVAGPGGFYTLYGNFALICDGNYGRQRVFGVPGVSAHPKGAIWHEFFARKIALGIKAAYLFPVGVGIMGLGPGLP